MTRDRYIGIVMIIVVEPYSEHIFEVFPNVPVRMSPYEWISSELKTNGKREY